MQISFVLYMVPIERHNVKRMHLHIFTPDVRSAFSFAFCLDCLRRLRSRKRNVFIFGLSVIGLD
jgi:hypothetical protein